MTHRIIHTMSEFYNLSGQMLRSETIEHGNFPLKTYTAVFHYEYGEARFDGKRWAWCIDGERIDAVTVKQGVH